ncbi:alpha-hydroxy acid oxidase [Novosphingobium sp. PASSN1]|uniref:alpha-hydroxy acid oxidase n=1 Tax=Novosphingobium sp. PASSN1 TaxID=2015561 RepID=UPI000BD903CF|nr:alpha-hydroxy acid oxidase [Novosphingobium sp. PASSN1]OYU34753.1 MAG: alpha-hydroxy-acid oxidizing enzyme [Novosphingobium sp. PASSN1]
MGGLDQIYNIEDLARLARRRIPRGLFEFIDRGAEDEVTTRANEACLKDTFLRQRVGIDVSTRDLSVSLFGVRQNIPIGVGVTGLVGMLAYRGEFQIAQAAAAAGVPYTLGNANFASLAEVKAICGDLLWRQLYPLQQPIMDHQIRIAKEAGVRVLVITMDSAMTGNREYMYRNGFAPRMMNAETWRQMLLSPRWLAGTVLRYKLNGGLPEIADLPEGQRAFFGKKASFASAPVATFSWESLREVRRTWQDILVVKGISTAEDARTAADLGVDGIIVSNHGGRSLDGCIPSFAALPQIVDAVAPKVTVMVDGGFKRGADVLKAIAAGASCVWVGRATTYGLAAAGQAGVARALSMLESEFSRTMALMGCTKVDQLNRDMLQLPR